MSKYSTIMSIKLTVEILQKKSLIINMTSGNDSDLLDEIDFIVESCKELKRLITSDLPKENK